MRINSICLYNFGSYEGINEFNISEQNKKGNIVVIGGKNGAGKTTLFSGIKLCLYGVKETGYESICASYKKYIKRLINDRAKAENNVKAYVRLEFSIFNGQEWDEYSLKRAWDLNDDRFEYYNVVKNGILLNDEELIDFESFLLSIIPPELFDLYFFDGEQIAEYFLEDNNNERIKNAILTVCGYDTFDILLKNFKRSGRGTSTKSDILEEYLQAEDDLHLFEIQLNDVDTKLDEINKEIERQSDRLNHLENEYKFSGGITIDQWEQKFIDLKGEEKLREEKNNWLKNAANDVIPYIILRETLKKLQNQMNNEKESERINVLKESVISIIPQIICDIAKKHKEFNKDLQNIVSKEIIESAELKHEPTSIYLDLSKDEYNRLSLLISRLINLNKKDILDAKRDIQRSIERSQAIRKSIEKSHINNINDFLKSKEDILKTKNELVNEQLVYVDERKEITRRIELAKKEYEKKAKELDKQLKNESIADLTGKSILFIEELQKRLLKSEIDRIEKLFMKKMSQLMRKERFIDAIRIDENFCIHIYKTMSVECKGICDRIKQLSIDKYQLEYGIVHVESILKASGCSSLKEFMKCNNESNKDIEVLMEFDKNIMSKGEKQVFIMSLYWSIMQLSNKEVPFVIDTPFARIDTIHRKNITNYFFKELKGQVFIFSTDEEITSNHMKLIGKDLSAKFLIENIDNSKTIIKKNEYFS